MSEVKISLSEKERKKLIKKLYRNKNYWPDEEPCKEEELVAPSFDLTIPEIRERL